MDLRGWAEIAFTLIIGVALAWPLGAYMARVWRGERTWLDPVLRPVECVLYKALGTDPAKGQTWVSAPLPSPRSMPCCACKACCR